MTATTHRIEDGVEGPAYVIVPISESKVTRVVFNAVADHEFGRELQSSDEIVEVWDMMEGKHGDSIGDALNAVGRIDPLDEDDLEKVYTEVKEQLEQ